MAIGRPPKYDEKFLPLIEGMCKLGATDKEIAESLDIDVRTLYRWKHKHESLCQVLKLAKAPATDRVERALYHRATGYDWEERTITKEIDSEGNVISERVSTVIKHAPPETGAMNSYLNNRASDRWKSKQSVEISGDDISERMRNARARMRDNASDSDD